MSFRRWAEGVGAVPVLIELLADEQHALRYASSHLYGYNSDRIMRPFEQSPVVRALKDIGRAENSVVPTLVREVSHENPNVRSAVAIALGGIGEGAKAATPALRSRSAMIGHLYACPSPSL